jgi:sensor histidine kinase regulating citrate/malate metabolism
MGNDCSEKVPTMTQKTHWNTSDTLSPVGDERMAADYVWATSQKSKLRALSLYLIRSIVEKHGGTIKIDLATDTINIDVPDQEKDACAQEIEEQVGAMCY